MLKVMNNSFLIANFWQNEQILMNLTASDYNT